MIKNYLLVALRSLRRNKLHAGINIVGLAIGMTCCILIALYVQFELGYDRQNKNADRIYRLTVDLEANNWAISAFPLGAMLKQNFPEVETYTRFKPTEAFLLNAAADTPIKNKEKIFYADSSVFDVMDIALIKGDPRLALAEINSMVMTEEKARTYFGDADPVGKTLTMLSDKQEYLITGVFKPLPSNSHVHMDIMVSSENFPPMRPNSPQGWDYLTNHYTYLVLPRNFDYVSFEKKVSAFLDKFQERKPEDPANVLHLQPLTSIHLHSNLGLEVEANGNMSTVYTLASVAFFILIIACINFMNLATAQSMRRAKEVGIRKVVGSRRRQLVFQFLSESVVISFFALLISGVLLALAVPRFNLLSGKHITINPLENAWVVLLFGAITLFVGVAAGAYPAFFLSRFNPVQVLKGKFVGNRSGQLLRKGLVVFQFAVAFIIMVGTYIVYYQLDYMLKKDMGFDREQVLVLTLPKDSIGDRAVKNELTRLSGVTAVTRFNEIPGRMVRTSGFWYEGIANDNKAENMYNFSGDADLLATLGMKMKAGSFFREDSQQQPPEFVINETAVRHFGWKIEDAVGKLMDFGGRSATPGRVIGVIEDFHFKHLHDAIDPLVMYLEPHYEGRFMAIKLKAGDVTSRVQEVERAWKTVAPGREFEYQFLDETFDKLFDQEKKLGQLFAVFAMLAILISCLGLFGLASFTMEQSRKEVAVRKVLGASIPNIVSLMSREFLGLVLVGMIAASPVAYVATSRWLEGFAYNVGFAWIVFVYAALVSLAVAFLTVGYHCMTAATANPVNALKE